MKPTIEKMPVRPSARAATNRVPQPDGPPAGNLTANGDGSADLVIYGYIGDDDCSAEAIGAALRSTNATTINVRINSGGGDVFDGAAIYNSLRSHGATIVAHIDGVAASAASWIAQAGDEVRIAKNAYMMIHDPSGIVFGTADDMRQAAGVLDKMKGSIAQVYADRSGKPVAGWMDAMSAETWYVGQEAVDAGLADALSDADAAEPVVTNEQVKSFNHAPRGLLAAVRNRTNQTTGPGGKPASRDAAATAATRGADMASINLEAFNAFAAENPDAVARFVNQGKTAGIAEGVQQERQRAEGVRNACGDNVLLALNLIAGGQDVEAAKVAAKAAADARTEAQNKADADAKAIKDRDDKIKELEGKLELKNSGSPPVGTRSGGSGGGQPAGPHPDIAAFDNAVKALTDAGMSKAAAINKVVDAQPAVHQAYVKAVNDARAVAAR